MFGVLNPLNNYNWHFSMLWQCHWMDEFYYVALCNCLHFVVDHKITRNKKNECPVILGSIL